MIGRIIAAAFQFRFMALAIDVIDRHDPSNEMRRQLQPNKTNIIPLYSSKRRSSHPSLQMRRSASVLKVGVSYESKMVKCVASYSQRRLRYGYISRLYSCKRCFSHPSLLTRRSALVLKMGMS